MCVRLATLTLSEEDNKTQMHRNETFSHENASRSHQKHVIAILQD